MNYLNPCKDLSIAKLTAPPAGQSNPPDQDYSGTNTVFTYTEYTVEPSFCPITITCDSVTPVQADVKCPDNGPFKGAFTVTNNWDSSKYGDGGIEPGDYVYTFTV